MPSRTTRPHPAARTAAHVTKHDAPSVHAPEDRSRAADAGTGTETKVPVQSTTPPPRFIHASDLALFTKNDLAQALINNHITHAAFARMTGVDVDRVEDWISPTSRTHVPAWLYSHPGVPPCVHDYLRDAAAARRGVIEALGADTIEAQLDLTVSVAQQELIVLTPMLKAPHLTRQQRSTVLRASQKMGATAEVLARLARQGLAMGSRS